MKTTLLIALGEQFIVATVIFLLTLSNVLTLNDTHMHKALISK